mgnify:CR=1 FL=1
MAYNITSLITTKELALYEKHLSICLRTNGLSFSVLSPKGTLLTAGEVEMTFTTNFNLYNYNLVGGVDSAAVLMDDGRVEVMYFELRERHGFTWNAKESIDFRLPYDISGQFSLNYRSPRVAAQGTTKQEFVMNIGFKRPFFNKKLNLSLSVRDITNSRNRNVVTWGEQFHQKSISKRNSRTFALTATYNFGTNNKDKKGKNGKDGDSSRDDDMIIDDFD